MGQAAALCPGAIRGAIPCVVSCTPPLVPSLCAWGILLRLAPSRLLTSISPAFSELQLSYLNTESGGHSVFWGTQVRVGFFQASFVEVRLNY